MEVPNLLKLQVILIIEKIKLLSPEIFSAILKVLLHKTFPRTHTFTECFSMAAYGKIGNTFHFLKE